MLLSFGACSDDEYTELFLDPSKVTEPQVPNLFTGVLLRCRDYSNYGYGRFFGFDSQFVGKFAQTFGFGVGTGMYQPGYAASANGQNGAVYMAMMDYKKMLAMLDEMLETEQTAFEAYRLGAMVNLYDWFLACVDIFGDMPFFEACQLPLTNDIVASYAKYDKAEDIYSAIMDELKVAGEKFSDPTLNKHKSFNPNDIVNQGDFKKWALYANSVRLRAAIRISQYGSLTDKGKAAIKEILENPDKYPIVESNDNNIFLKNDHSGDLNYEGGGGLGDWTSCRMASGAIVDRMLSNGNWKKTIEGGKDVHIPGSGAYLPETDDPRICLLYTMRRGTGGDGAQSYNYSAVIRNPLMKDSIFYIGVNLSEYYTDPGYYDDGGHSEIVQGGFFWQNKNFEHVQITAAEMLFCKAEAYHRGWGVAKDETKAEAAFKEGIKQSIELYYHWNDVNNNASTEIVEIPDNAEIEAFAAARWASSVNPAIPYSAADPHLDAILTQKWLHWGIFFSRHGWSQIRRTGLPKLIYPRSGGIIDWAPDRWRYTADERNYNPYYPGEANDTYYDKAFWADPNGMRHSVYSNGAWTDQYGD